MNSMAWGEYQHCPNDINFTHVLWYSAMVLAPDTSTPNYSLSMDFHKLMMLRVQIQDRGIEFCDSVGHTRYKPAGAGLIFPAAYDYRVDISSYYTYFGFQNKNMAMAFKLGFSM